MEDIKSKVFESANQFKGKFESSQELNELKTNLRELEKKRTGYILELGENTYTSYRRGDGIELEKTEKIVEIDRKIHDTLEAMEQIKMEIDGRECQCGNKLELGDRFCKECGREVETEVEIADENLRDCSICQAKNHKENKYCIACGNKFK